MFANPVASADIQDDIDMREYNLEYFPFKNPKLEEGFSWTLKEPMINRSRWVGLAKGFTPDPSVKFLPRYPVAVIGESGTRTRRRDIATFDQLTVGLEHEKEKA